MNMLDKNRTGTCLSHVAQQPVSAVVDYDH